MMEVSGGGVSTVMTREGFARSDGRRLRVIGCGGSDGKRLRLYSIGPEHVWLEFQVWRTQRNLCCREC